MNHLNNQGVDSMAVGEWDLAVKAFSQFLRVARQQAGSLQVAATDMRFTWEEWNACLLPLYQSILESSYSLEQQQQQVLGGLRFPRDDIDLSLASAVAVYNLATCLQRLGQENASKAKALYLHATSLVDQVENKCDDHGMNVFLAILRLAIGYNLGLLHSVAQATTNNNMLLAQVWNIPKAPKGSLVDEIQLFFFLQAMACGRSSAPAA